ARNIDPSPQDINGKRPSFFRSEADKAPRIIHGLGHHLQLNGAWRVILMGLADLFVEFATKPVKLLEGEVFRPASRGFTEGVDLLLYRCVACVMVRLVRLPQGKVDGVAYLGLNRDRPRDPECSRKPGNEDLPAQRLNEVGR